MLTHQPDVVTVSFGLNDTGGREPEKFGESLKKICATLRDAGVQVVLMTSTPFNSDRHFWGEKFEADGGLDAYMNSEFCERTRKLAKHKNIPLCDLHTIFTKAVKQDGKLIDKLISTDGVHLTAEGYLMVADHVAPLLQKVLAEK